MESIAKKLKEVIQKLFGVEVEPEVTVAPEKFEADYASNVAMRLAGQLGRSPREIAEEIAKEYGGEIEVAGPGFLNFKVDDSNYLDKMVEISEQIEGAKTAKDGVKALVGEWDGRTVLTEFSDPNPFKVLHVGHLYTTIIGDTVARLYEKAGAKVFRANFGGDVGMHVAKNMYVMMKHEDELERLEKEGTNRERMEFLAKCYVEGSNEFEDDPKANKEIVQLNKKVFEIAERGIDRPKGTIDEREDTEFSKSTDEETAKLAKIYWMGRGWSFDYFEEFYARIGVKFDKYYPESGTARKGLPAVQQGLKDGVFIESDGAVVFPGDKYDLHTRVFINKEGVPTYEAKDLGGDLYKWGDYHPDKSVIITGDDIRDYMKVVFKALSLVEPEVAKRMLHITHGNVKLTGGVKMSSRKGNFLRAEDVIDSVNELLSDDKGKFDERVSLGAIKYAFLKGKMNGDTNFDLKESVSMTGNSGVYLLYSTVRAKKILSKIFEESSPRTRSRNPSSRVRSLDLRPVASESSCGENFFKNRETPYTMDEYEKKLVKKICDYPAMLETAVKELAPHKICGYLYELAQEFSRFYEHDKVSGDAHEAERGEMVKVYEEVMEDGLNTLGIEVPEEM